jgi:hypothetical protein
MCFHVFSLSPSLSVLFVDADRRYSGVDLHSHTHSLSLSVSPLPCLSLFHLKGAATPKSGSIEIQISLYSVLIISKVAPTRNLFLFQCLFLFLFHCLFLFLFCCLCFCLSFFFSSYLSSLFYFNYLTLFLSFSFWLSFFLSFSTMSLSLSVSFSLPLCCKLHPKKVLTRWRKTGRCIK